METVAGLVSQIIKALNKQGSFFPPVDTEIMCCLEGFHKWSRNNFCDEKHSAEFMLDERSVRYARLEVCPW